MGLSPISPLRLVASESSTEPSVTKQMTDVRTAHSILDGDTAKKLHLSSSSSNEMPSQLQGCDSVFSTDEQKKKTERRDLKDVKGSNTVSNDKKAQGQIIALSLATLIGAILAPLTGGMSLIPTAFVVLYGNSAALAMYGGSQYFIDDEKDKERDPNLPEPAPQDNYSPSNHLDKQKVRIDPDLTPINRPDEVIENDQTDSSGIQSDKINQRIVEDMAKAAEIAMPENLIQREEIATIEHRAEIETVKDSIEWVMLDNGDESDDYNALSEAIQQALNMPIEDCIDYAPDIDLVDFSIPVADLPELGDLNIAFDQKCVTSHPVHEDENVKVFAIRNLADIKQADEPKIVSQKQLSAPRNFKFTVKTHKPMISTQGSSSALGSNRLSGITNNMGDVNHIVKQPPISTDLLSKSLAPMISTQGSSSALGSNRLSGIRNNMGDVNHIVKQPPISTDLLSKSLTPMISTQGSSSALGSNRLSGITNNMGDVNYIVKQPPISTDLLSKSLTPMISTQGSSSALGSNHLSGIRNNMGAVNQIVKQPPKFTSFLSKSLTPMISTQGSSSALGSNRLSGIRNNMGVNRNRDEAVLTSNSKPSTKFTTQIPMPDITPSPLGIKKTGVDLHNIAKAVSLAGVKASPKYTVNIPNRIVTTQSSSRLASNNSAGIRRNIKEIHNENVNQLASSYWKGTGIDKPVALNIMGNVLAISPVNLSKLDYVIENGKAS